MARGRPFPLQVLVLLVHISRYAALGQSIAFVPWSDDFSMLAGESYSIEWSGGNDQDIIISLLAYGNTNDILDVIFHGPPVPSSFLWVVPSDLDPLTLYVLRLNQGITDVFSSTFLVLGGHEAATSSSSSVTPAYPSYTSSTASSETVLQSSSSSPTANDQPTNSTSNSPSPSPIPQPNQLGPGAIAGIVIGSIGTLALLVIAGILILRYLRTTLSSSDRNESTNRHSNISELSAGFTANRHEAGGSDRTSHVGDRDEGKGSNVRLSGNTAITTGTM